MVPGRLRRARSPAASTTACNSLSARSQTPSVAEQIHGETPVRPIGRCGRRREGRLDLSDPVGERWHRSVEFGGGEQIGQAEPEGSSFGEHETRQHRGAHHRTPPARTSPSRSRTSTGARSNVGPSWSRPTMTFRFRWRSHTGTVTRPRSSTTAPGPSSAGPGSTSRARWCHLMCHGPGPSAATTGRARLRRPAASRRRTDHDQRRSRRSSVRSARVRRAGEVLGRASTRHRPLPTHARPRREVRAVAAALRRADELKFTRD